MKRGRKHAHAVCRQGCEREQISALLRTQPTLLLHEEKALQRKWRFLQEEMRLPAADIMSVPALLALALTQIIGPRFHLLQARGQLHRVQGLDGGKAGAAPSSTPGAPTAARLDEQRGGAAVSEQQAGATLAAVQSRSSPAAGTVVPTWAEAHGTEARVSLQSFAEMPLAQFCSTFGLQPQAWRDYKVAWWRTHGLKWGGVNMQLPENTAGWRQSVEAAAAGRSDAPSGPGCVT